MFRQVRAEIFERAPALQGALAEAGADFRGEDLTRAAHRFKAWVSLRGRLRPSQVRQARERGEAWALSYDQYVGLLERIGAIWGLRRRVANVEDAIEALYEMILDLALVPPLLPRAPRERGYAYVAPPDWNLGSQLDEFRRRLGKDLLDALVGILGGLLDEFVAQLEDLAVFELPPYEPPRAPIEVRVIGGLDRGAGPPGALERGAVVSDFGETVVLTASVAAGGAGEVLGPPVLGPSVVERILFTQAAGITGTLEVRAVGSGSTGGSGAGDALLIGPSGAVISVTGVAFFGDWWPRRLVRQSGYRIFMRYVNTGAVANQVMLGVDRRDVIWPAEVGAPLRPMAVEGARALVR